MSAAFEEDALDAYPAWLDAALEHLAITTDATTVHPAEQAVALGIMLHDLAELRLDVERSLGLAMLALDDHRGRSMPDEPMPERREMRIKLGLDRTQLTALLWLARVTTDTIDQMRAELARSSAVRAWSLRSLHREFGRGGKPTEPASKPVKKKSKP